MLEINYCVRCGAAMEDRFAYGKIRRVCPACEHVHFTDPKVAAVVFLRDGDRVLLVKRAMNPERGKWALPAGYVDAGEDPRAAAIRETVEETGLEITIHRLLDVVFNPPIPNTFHGASIAIIYAGRVVGGTLQAQDDVDDVGWFTKDSLPEIAFLSTRQAIERWLSNRS